MISFSGIADKFGLPYCTYGDVELILFNGRAYKYTTTYGVVTGFDEDESLIDDFPAAVWNQSPFIDSLIIDRVYSILAVEYFNISEFEERIDSTFIETELMNEAFK